MSNFHPIKEFAKVRIGASPRPIGDPSYFEENGQTGWVRIVDVTGAAQKYLSKTEQYLSPLGESKSVRVNPGDLIMSICATVGKPIILDMPACIHDGFVQLYDLANIDSEYLYYVLQFHEQGFVKKAQPGTQINLNTTIVENEIIFVPQAKVQRKINQVLSTIDNQITQTQSLIDKYTAIKQGMMVDLFSRGIDTSTGQLRPSFEEAPELYKETELGWLPKEWQVLSMADLAADEKGSTVIGPFGSDLIAADYRDEGVPIIFVRDVKESGLNWISNTYISKEKARQLSAHQVTPGDIVATKMGLPPCVSAEYPSGLPDGIITADIIRLRPNLAKALPKWISDTMNCDFVKKQVEEITAGVTRPKVTLRDFRLLKSKYPTLREQQLILDKISTIESLIQKESENRNKLKLQKKDLMQDLLTGKVYVPV